MIPPTNLGAGITQRHIRRHCCNHWSWSGPGCHRYWSCFCSRAHRHSAHRPRHTRPHKYTHGLAFLRPVQETTRNGSAAQVRNHVFVVGDIQRSCPFERARSGYLELKTNSTPLFSSLPTLRSWVRKPDEPGTFTFSSKPLVFFCNSRFRPRSGYPGSQTPAQYRFAAFFPRSGPDLESAKGPVPARPHSPWRHTAPAN